MNKKRIVASVVLTTGLALGGITAASASDSGSPARHPVSTGKSKGGDKGWVCVIGKGHKPGGPGNGTRAAETVKIVGGKVFVNGKPVTKGKAGLPGMVGQVSGVVGKIGEIGKAGHAGQAGQVVGKRCPKPPFPPLPGDGHGKIKCVIVSVGKAGKAGKGTPLAPKPVPAKPGSVSGMATGAAGKATARAVEGDAGYAIGKKAGKGKATLVRCYPVIGKGKGQGAGTGTGAGVGTGTRPATK